MKYVKAGFVLAIGWYVGKAVFDTAVRVTNDLICHYVPEKYWNKNCPEYLGKTTVKTRATNKAKMKIGFSTD